VLQVAEIMLTLVTVNAPPRPLLVLELELLLDGEDDVLLLDGDDEDDDEELLGDDEELLGDDEFSMALLLPPDMRPVTITWWPTCSDRFTEVSAVSMMSFDDPAEPLIEPAVRLLGSLELEPAVPEAVPDAVEPDVEPDAVPEAEPVPLALVPDELEPELILPLPNFAFFSTKPPPAPVLLDVLLEALLELLLSRCRQPVAVICPAVSLDERLVDELPCGLVVGWLLCGLDVVGWLLCGVDEVGDCAASVPHSATLLHSVTAHCQ